MSDTTPEVAPVVDPVEVEVEADPNAEYVSRARDVLARLDATPMSTHETRILKEAFLTVFGPAIEEASKHVKVE